MMNKSVASLLRRAALLLGALAVATLAQAQTPTYPNGPIKLIVPFPAGGTADFVARLLGERLGAQLRVPVVVENRVGANGNIATEAAAHSAADGQTLLLGSTPNLVINPSLYRKVNFDTLRDFVPIAMLATAPNILVINPRLKINSVAQLVAAAKASPGKITLASGGNGSTGHLAGVMLQQAAGIDLLHVPYRGGPQALADLLGGQVDVLIFTIPTVMPHISSGKITALAVTNPKRSTTMPEFPTLAESGYPGFDASPWFGLLAPAGTPTSIVQRLANEVSKAWSDGDVKHRLAQQGVEAMSSTPEQFTAQITSDLVRWTKAVKHSGATID